MKKYTKEKLLKMDVIEVYKMILDGEIKAFPQGCWEQENAKENAAKCTKFLIEKVLKIDIEDLRKESLTDLFNKNKLSGMLSACFDSSPYKAIDNAYPSRFKEWEFKSTPSRYWLNKYNGVKATRWLFEEKLKLTDEEIKEQLSVKLFEDNGLRGMLAKCFNGSIYDAINSAYPHRFKEWEFKVVPSGYWDNPENAKNAVRWLIEEKLQLSERGIKEKLSVQLFKDNGLGWVITKCFNGSLYEAVNSVYPNKYKEWELKKAPKGLWNDKENGIKATRWLIEEKLQLSDDEVRTCLSYKLFEDNGLGGMLQTCFNDSPYEAINAAYPNKYKEWEVSLVPKGFWNDKENGIKAARWLFEEKLKLSDDELKKQVSVKLFTDNGLRGMLRRCFDDSPYEAVNAVYPGKFKRWEVGPVSRGFWDNSSNVINAIKWLFEEKLQLSDEEIKDQLSVKLFSNNGLRGMLRKCFNDSPYEAINAAYPQRFEKDDFRFYKEP